MVIAAEPVGMHFVRPEIDPLRDSGQLVTRQSFGAPVAVRVRDSNGHERRAHGGLALDSHSRRRTEHSCPQRATSGTSGMSGMSGR
jgi:hypothetical protein